MRKRERAKKWEIGRMRKGEGRGRGLRRRKWGNRGRVKERDMVEWGIRDGWRRERGTGRGGRKWKWWRMGEEGTGAWRKGEEKENRN